MSGGRERPLSAAGHDPEGDRRSQDCSGAGKKKLPEAADVRLRLLEREACLEAEGLWREVFDEDTARFTDYYFSHKAAKNRGLVLEGAEGIRAMLYLTPESMVIGAGPGAQQERERPVECAYIVGVATRRQYRHRGYMAALLNRAFRMLYEERMPLVFLMPASADIYTPFDFTYIYDRPVWNAAALKTDRLTVLGMGDVARMADFARDFLKREKGVYVCRDPEYYITQLLEADAQEGCLFGYEEETSGSVQKALKGLCTYTCEEGSPQITEILTDAETEARFAERTGEKQPAIMARIIHLERVLSGMRSKAPFSFVLGVTDPLIAQNDGSFFCEVREAGTGVRRCDPDTVPDTVFSIAELTAVLFGYRRTADPFLSRLYPFAPVWINEIV